MTEGSLGITGSGGVGGDEPEGVAGAEADGIEEASVGIAGAEQALEGLSDTCADGGVDVVRFGHGVAPTGGTLRAAAAPLRGLVAVCNREICGWRLGFSFPAVSC